MMKPAEGLAAAALLGLATAAAAEGPSPSFLDAVERYRRGETVREAWSADRLRRSVADLKRLQDQSFPFEAAAMLFTDRDVQERTTDPGQEEVAPQSAPLLEAARQVLELIQDPERRRSFERPWLLAVALHLQQHGQWPLAMHHLELGLARYPEDPRFLLARGSLLEAQGARDLQVASPAGRDQLQQAEGCYRRALAADPELLEARLRLGHVLHRLGRPERAVPELASVIAAPEAKPRIRYLAWLFLGAVREAEGRPGDAVPAYAAAIGLLPHSQAAYVALSHALHRVGERAGSREALEKATARAGRRLDQDPWWGYPWGQSLEADERILALRLVTR